MEYFYGLLVAKLFVFELQPLKASNRYTTIKYIKIQNVKNLTNFVLLPAEESRITTQPSIMLNAFSTSMVKSMCPGVSTKLIWWSFQVNDADAEVMVIPKNI